jgi:hypothetical protein
MRDWILLDNGSTVDIFCNPRLLKNIRETNVSMNISTNGGSFTTRTKGDLKGYGEVWYHPCALTNIISLSRLARKYRVTYDSTGTGKFTVHKNNELLHF